MNRNWGPVGEVVSIIGKHKASPEYHAARVKAVGVVETAHEAVFDAAVQLAIAGPWAAWAEKQPAGTMASFTSQHLIETHEPNLVTLGRLLHSMEATAEELAIANAFTSDSIPNAEPTRIAAGPLPTWFLQTPPVAPGGGGGRLAVAVYPGASYDSQHGRIERDLAVDLDHLRDDLGVTALVSIASSTELRDLNTTPVYAATMSGSGRFRHLALSAPPEDVPKRDQFVRVVDDIADLMLAGYTVAICSPHGGGRACLVAAATIIALGWPVERALAVLDRAHPRPSLSAKQDAVLREIASAFRLPSARRPDDQREAP